MNTKLLMKVSVASGILLIAAIISNCSADVSHLGKSLSFPVLKQNFLL